MSRTLWQWALLGALASSSPSLGAGFYIGENGTRALLQGGAFTAQADDLSAVQHNPAGLSQLTGAQFHFDSLLLNHEVSFQRKDAGGATSAAETVSNVGGPFYAPNLFAGYGTELAGRPLFAALGVYGPPAVGRYQFPSPVYEKDSTGRYSQNPRKFAPSRYGLIHNDILLFYPSLSASYQLHPRFSVGGTLQVMFSRFAFTQAVYSGLSTPQRQAEEDPIFDSIVNVEVSGQPVVTGVLGVWAKPWDNLSVGASVRPPIPVRATGKLALELGEAATGLNTVVTGDQAELTLTLPLEARVGLRFTPLAQLGLNLDVVYQGWQSMQELVLSPQAMTMKVGSGEETPIAPFRIPKKWRPSFSARLGGSWAFESGLTAYAGAMYEQGASPLEYVNIDFAHFDRALFTAGVGYRFSRFEVLLGGAYTPPVSVEVSQSEVRAGSTDSTVPGSIVGLGTYGSSGWLATLGLRGNLGGR